MTPPTLETVEKMARLVVSDCCAYYVPASNVLLLRVDRGGDTHEVEVPMVHLRSALYYGGIEHLSEVIVMAAHGLEELIDDEPTDAKLSPEDVDP